ncbi:MAG: GldG family protein [Coraliomargaritaceae bacterium]
MSQIKMGEFGFARRARAANLVIQVVLFLSLLFGLNYLASRHFTRIDLSRTGTYTLSAESKAYIRTLEKPVNILVTIPDESGIPELQQIHNDLRKLLRQYEAEGDANAKSAINVEFIDIYKQRKRAEEIARRYNITGENVILVSCGERTREIRQAQLYESDGENITGFCGERVFTSAIIELVAEKAEKLYFIVGHGEMRLNDVDPILGLSQLENFLQERNMEVAELDLSLAPTVPEDADLLFLASPQGQLMPEEVEKLRRYLSERNGRLIVFLNPGRRHGMDDLFYDWGVLAEDLAVFDTSDDFRASGGDLIIRRFAPHPITQMLLDYKITGLFGLPRPVRADPAALNVDGLKVEQIIGTSSQSWAERDFRSQTQATFDLQRDIPGPISIATVSTRSSGSDFGINIQGGRLIVFGNADFIANNRLQIYGNQSLLINSVYWALNRNSLLNIPTRPLQKYQLIMSEREIRILLLYFAALPVLAALAGIIIHLIRSR